MWKWLAAIGIAIAVVLATLAGGDRDRPPVSSTPIARTAAPRPAPPVVAPSAPLDDTAVAESERAQTALIAMGRSCWAARTPLATRPGEPDETVQQLGVELALEVTAGVGHARLVTIHDDGVRDPALRACLLAGIANVRWSTPASDGRVELETTLRAGVLAIPSGPPATLPTSRRPTLRGSEPPPGGRPVP